MVIHYELENRYFSVESLVSDFLEYTTLRLFMLYNQRGTEVLLNCVICVRCQHFYNFQEYDVVLEMSRIRNSQACMIFVHLLLK